MNRIDSIFQTLGEQGGKALMPFITAGDGGVELLGQVIPALEQGASICEVGIRSDLADGSDSGLDDQGADNGTQVEQVFEQIASVRDKTSMGLVASATRCLSHRARSVRRAVGTGGL